MLDECFECDDHLRANGYLAAGEGLAGNRVDPILEEWPGRDHRRSPDLSDMVKQSEQRRRKRNAY
jgi:hypothetical protein